MLDFASSGKRLIYTKSIYSYECDKVEMETKGRYAYYSQICICYLKVNSISR